MVKYKWLKKSETKQTMVWDLGTDINLLLAALLVTSGNGCLVL